MTLRLEIVGDKDLDAKFTEMQPRLTLELERATARAALRLLAHVKEDHLNGPRPQNLGVKTGRLRRSITMRVETTEHEVSGWVGTNVEYARIHEYGGTYTGQIKNLKRPPHLARRKDGGMHMTGSPFQVKVPERSFLRSSLNEMADGIREELAGAARETVRGIFK